MITLIFLYFSSSFASELYPETCYNEDNSCGSFMKQKSRRIFGGTVAEKNQWPWLALIYFPNSDEMCTGSFISERWIISAGHCFQVREFKL